MHAKSSSEDTILELFIWMNFDLFLFVFIVVLIYCVPQAFCSRQCTSIKRCTSRIRIIATTSAWQARVHTHGLSLFSNGNVLHRRGIPWAKACPPNVARLELGRCKDVCKTGSVLAQFTYREECLTAHLGPRPLYMIQQWPVMSLLESKSGDYICLNEQKYLQQHSPKSLGMRFLRPQTELVQEIYWEKKNRTSKNHLSSIQKTPSICTACGYISRHWTLSSQDAEVTIKPQNISILFGYFEPNWYYWYILKTVASPSH